MNVLNLAERLILGPVELFDDLVLTAILRLSGSVTVAIIGLGLAVCLLATPLRPAARPAPREDGWRLPKLWLLQLACLAASWLYFSRAEALRGTVLGLFGGLGKAGAFAMFWLSYAVFAVLRHRTGLGYRPMELNIRQRKTDRRNRILLVCCCLYLAVLTGLLIPSEILSASPGEFTDARDYRDPGLYLADSGLTAAGLFLLWGTLYGLLLDPKARKRYVTGLAALAAVSAADYMFFGRGYGIISSALQYETAISVPAGTAALNTACVLLLAAGTVCAFRRWPGVVRIVCIYGCAALTALSAVNIVRLETKAAEIRETAGGQTEEKASFRFSRKGKNVAVIMLDRTINGFVPWIMNEKPELLRQFDGFTYYPNTLSYGYHTNIAAPALFGGYEYTPEELEKRTEESLKDKHNEALKVMPAVFLERGYEVTVCDAPYANYQWTPDMSIYDEYPAIRTWNTIGMFGGSGQEDREWLDSRRERNLFCYSLFRCAPSLLQPAMYDGGNWLATAGQEQGGTSGISPDFMKSYLVMRSLPAMTKVTDDETNTFLMLTNEMTHNVIELQEPDYVPVRTPDNAVYEAEHGIRKDAAGRELDLGFSELLKIHYHGDMAAFLLLGEWFDDLRAQGVWDNTKIIIVSDHGCYLGLTGVNLAEADPSLPDVPGYEKSQWADTTCYNPILMVKDFGASGFTTDRTFMTNADTPALAFAQAAEDPVNPFTGNPVTSRAKDAGEHRIVESAWDIMTNNGSFFSDPLWITFRGNDIFNPENWSAER